MLKGQRRGLAGLILVIVIAWALAAVLMLTGTLLAARQIDERVEAITGITSEIDQDLDAVEAAARTARIAGDIYDAARPLSGQLQQVIRVTASIDTTANSILDTASAIDNRVESIEATAAAINLNAESIDATVEQIEGRARSIEGRATSIDETVGDIRRRFVAIRGEARSIDAGVRGINLNANQVIRVVRPIEGDLDDILEEVGPRHETPPGPGVTIHGHANSIDCRLRGEHCDD